MTTSAIRLSRRFSLQALVWCLLIAAGAITIILSSSELNGISSVLKGARLEYLLLVLIVRLVFAVNMGLFYSSTFRALDLQADSRRFVLIAAAGHFLNLVSKSSGFGGLALFLRDSERKGQPALKVAAAYATAYVLNYVGYLGVLIAALVLLFLRGSLTTTEAIAAAIVFAVVLLVGGGLVLGMRNAPALGKVLGFVLSPVNRAGMALLHKPLLSPERIEASLHGFRDAFELMQAQRWRFIMPFLHGLTVELLSIATLYSVGLMLQVHISPGLAVAGYALSILFTIFSITPSGLGVVEASLAVFLASTGMTRHEAIATTLGYRLFDFWFPVVVGGVCALYLRLPRKAAST